MERRFDIHGRDVIGHRGAESGDVIGEVPKMGASRTGRTGINEDERELAASPAR